MLVDTSVLIRTLQPRHLLYASAERALRILPLQGWELHIVAQNLIELWAVATRPLRNNGLGMTPSQASIQLELVKRAFPLLPDTKDIYSAWEALVLQHQVCGKPSHDARLVAAMQVHGITAILTFDKTGFSRFPNIEVIDPREVHPQ